MRGMLKIYLFVKLYVYLYVHTIHMMNRIRQTRGRVQEMRFERLEKYLRVNMRRCCK